MEKYLYHEKRGETYDFRDIHLIYILIILICTLFTYININMQKINT